MSDLRSRLDECLVSMASRAQLKDGDRLPPRLWENLRRRLQSIYRQSTGEEMATLIVDGLHVEVPPSPAKQAEEQTR